MNAPKNEKTFLSTFFGSDKNFQPQRWKFLFKQHKNTCCFLVCLIPDLEYIYQALDQQIQDFSHLSATPNFLLRWIKHNLLPQLSFILSQVCVLEMQSASKRGILMGDTAQTRFQSYLQLLAQPENSQALFKKYPQLANAIKNLLTNFLTAQQEFLQRLNQDWQLLNDVFFKGDATYQLHDIDAGGDAHQHGRRVLILKFRNTPKNICKIVYKPRSLKIDQAWQNLLLWVNQKNKKLDLLPYTICDCEDYGWCEFITYLPCHSEQEIKQFYQRSGMLLALLYLLSGNDIHHENLIAHGAYPVIVDCECLLKPILLRGSLDLNPQQQNFVSESLMLPQRMMMTDDFTGYDVSALGGKSNQTAYYSSIRWENVGTDQMQQVRKRLPLKKTCHQPHLKNKTIYSDHYKSDIEFGFEQCYHLLLENKYFLLSSKSPLQKFKHCQTRVLLRNTGDYAKLLYESFHPKLLYYPQQRQQHFAWLEKALQHFEYYKTIITNELTDLEQGDIPIFICKTNSKKLLDSHSHPIDLKILTTGWNFLQNNLKNIFSEPDLFLQKHIIASSFEALNLTNKNQRTFSKLNLDINHNNLSSRAKTLAFDILDQLIKIKIDLKPNIYWPTLQLMRQNIWKTNFTDLDLYNGASGLMLCFYYASKTTNNNIYKNVAKKCWQHIQYQLEHSENNRYVENDAYKNIGFYNGVSGLIYCITKLPAEPKNQSTLNLLCNHLTPKIANDKILDIIGGSAGCLTALITANKYLPPTHFKNLSRNCVERILQLYPQPDIHSEQFQGVSNNSKPATGFAHGAIGMAWALNRYYALFPSAEVFTWIQAALKYQRENFDSNNTSWCHGSTGIGLALLDMQKYLPDQIDDQQINIALTQTLKSFKQINYSAHCLCHGLMGNLDFLYKISQEKPHLFSYQEYLNYAAALVQHIEQHGVAYALQGHNSVVGLMTGLSGVVYQLLRIADPETVPSILLPT